ncbi:cadherin-like protein 26 [Trichomycterus rosablanca]|uniref:cadherin-like protein 26 n=1 Tax=Trichomycterus rosablanca TaxID=2290929 RepID=UPI002F360524
MKCGSANAKLRHKRDWIIETLSIEEEHKGPFPYLLGPIGLDESYLMNFRGSGFDEDPKDVLSIDKYSGSVFVHKSVDYESLKFLKLIFEARDNKGVVGRLRVEIRILDINDNSPLFNLPHYETTVNESARQDQTITTVVAKDKDDPSTLNGTFNFRLLSVTPQTDNVEFYIKQIQTTANIKFKGCLDYQKAQKYTLLIEAKDNGDKVQLSSTGTVVLHIIDENSHVPVITGHTGSGKIKEHTTGVEVLRLQVSDEDSRGSPAWRAEYSLHGDNDHYFQITTDPQTNEGVLTVIKVMDFEEQAITNVSIAVKNELPYFSCKIKDRPAQGSWTVETSNDASVTPKLYPVAITVEDVNDPPVFIPPVKEIMIMENLKVGTALDTLKAEDPDKTFASSFHFVKGEDENGWVTVDPKTGQVSVAKVMDRESPLVKNSTYRVPVYVVDNGEPPMTGTGTLIIHLGDQNDNVPVLTMNAVEMCLSDEESRANISAVDLDLPPYSNPFHYELLGDVRGKWKIHPTFGTTVQLIKQSNVHSGHYQFQVKVTDSQGSGMVQKFSVMVCDCSSTSSCHARSAASVQPGPSVFLIGFLVPLILLAVLVMALFSCKRGKPMIPTYDSPDMCILKSNLESPGTDCMTLPKFEPEPTKTEPVITQTTAKTATNFGAHKSFSRQGSMRQNLAVPVYTEQTDRRSVRRSSSTRSYRQVRNFDMVDTRNTKNSAYYYQDELNLTTTVVQQLKKRLLQIQDQELYDYDPHCYAYEGEAENHQDLDNISFSESDLTPDDLDDLDFRFNKLAAVCRPDLI